MRKILNITIIKEGKYPSLLVEVDSNDTGSITHIEYYIGVNKKRPLSLENFNAEKGEEIAYNDAKQQIWGLEGYRVKASMADIKSVTNEPTVILDPKTIAPATTMKQYMVNDVSEELLYSFFNQKTGDDLKLLLNDVGYEPGFKTFRGDLLKAGIENIAIRVPLEVS